MDIVSHFFNELEGEHYKNSLAEELVRKISQRYKVYGIEGVEELIKEIHQRHMGDEDEDK